MIRDLIDAGTLTAALSGVAAVLSAVAKLVQVLRDRRARCSHHRDCGCDDQPEELVGG